MYLRLIDQGLTHWSKDNRTVQGSSWSFRANQQPFTWLTDSSQYLKLLNDMQTISNPWGLWHWVACIEIPCTVHGACHPTWYRCTHNQSRWTIWHQFFGSPLVSSAIWIDWMQRLSAELNTLKRWQCYNQQGVSHATRFTKDIWESTYFKKFWKFWNWPSYSSICLQNWLRWHCLSEMSLLSVKNQLYKLQYYLLLMWNHSAICPWSCLSVTTDYKHSPASVTRIQ